MKQLLMIAGMLTTLASAGMAQSTNDTSSTRENRPIIDERTREDVRRSVNRVENEAREETQKSIEYQRRNELEWFQKGSVFVGGALGFGLGAGSGTYLTLNPRIGYFVQPGFVVGLRGGFDRRLATSYRSRQVGLFGRYYPFRTRIHSFVGAGYNLGREYASNIGEGDKAKFNSINLEAGVGFLATRNISGEIALESNYYDRSNPLAGRNRGGRVKFGINYFFTRAFR
ncbi:hypothetical protein [Arsenicibacter rosenii]|uniref:Outer membrane protein beta-barrel domain-containing protein n=1 Tax=Arsenicibacter rosenii TaxID=1750698 RepID=A0A1S2VJT7_9BACT|nr:hypothetical protein [Arsenicibacter rosenii]OIN59019.1 hypothetical protein BLX24_12460 [Arsenicibacter rosenii]